MNEVEKVFRDYVQSKGLKFTPERQIILNHVFECHGHFEAEELLIDMRKNNKRVSKATIYRTLALLVNSGLLREVIFGEKHAHYEHVYGHEHHDHLRCLGCGKIIEFIDDTIEEAQLRVGQRFKFTIADHFMEIIGYCNNCTPDH